MKNKTSKTSKTSKAITTVTAPAPAPAPEGKTLVAAPAPVRSLIDSLSTGAVQSDRFSKKTGAFIGTRMDFLGASFGSLRAHAKAQGVNDRKTIKEFTRLIHTGEKAEAARVLMLAALQAQFNAGGVPVQALGNKDGSSFSYKVVTPKDKGPTKAELMAELAKLRAEMAVKVK